MTDESTPNILFLNVCNTVGVKSLPILRRITPWQPGWFQASRLTSESAAIVLPVSDGPDRIHVFRSASAAALSPRRRYSIPRWPAVPASPRRRSLVCANSIWSAIGQRWRILTEGGCESGKIKFNSICFTLRELQPIQQVTL